MSPVFLDTVGLLALWDEADQWHADAARAFAAMKQSRCSLVTSEGVLLECGNAAARRPYREEVILLRTRMVERGEVVAPTAEELELAWEAYRLKDGAGAGIVDQISFLLMRRLQLTRAFTNDAHFRAAGFETLF
ncbi:MAG TPA: hypothetical protein VFV87_09460 [Pirellulaceae bacterium]|nr:hypothetical protein [Pirellulaceae bacterium]